MYRALYAYKSELPKYLSFEAGDRFTLIDTSSSNQWFLAQNGMGSIGYVPFNYIKKIEATPEQQVKFIDGAIEAVNLLATHDGGQLSHEQRLILKKLVKHRSDIIKHVVSHERQSKRRRPAPAPPVDKKVTEDSVDKKVSSPPSGHQVSPPPAEKRVAGPPFEKRASAGTAGKSGGEGEQISGAERKAVASPGASRGDVKQSRSSKPSPRQHHSGNKPDVQQCSSHVEMSKPDVVPDVSKSESSTYPPSLMSSMSSTSEFTTTQSPSETDGPNPFETDDDQDNSNPFEIIDEEEVVLLAQSQPKSSESTQHAETAFSHTDNRKENTEGEVASVESSELVASSLGEDDIAPLPPPNLEESYESGTSSMSPPPPEEDLPPPPPELYEEGLVAGGEEDLLPPAPVELTTPTKSLLSESSSHLFSSCTSEELDMYKKKAIEDCSCDDFQPKFDTKVPFFAKNFLKLPSTRAVRVTEKIRGDNEALTTLLAPSGEGGVEATTVELAQAHGVDVTHADCEEMIGEFRKLTGLSHEDSHWALMASMNLLASKVPHIKPSLEVVGLRFNMAHQCHSTGRDYRCEDTVAIEQHLSQLSAITDDTTPQYLEDDLDSMLDIVTGLTDTLSNAKQCVSVAAIQKDSYHMVETIARYYQMEARWVVHSCMLQLIEVMCRLNPMAIQEFLYTELPQEMVAEIQQHHNDETRFIQVCKTLGVIFMRGKPSSHKLDMSMDIHFFLWLLGMMENLAELGRHGDVEIVVALVCAYHLQHRDKPENPITEALKMAQGRTLLETALLFLSKHDDPTQLLGSGLRPRVNSVILLLSHLYAHPDTSDLLYTNDVEALIGILEEFLRDLSQEDPMRIQILTLTENFMRNYPDTVSFKRVLSSRLGPLLLNIKAEKAGKQADVAARILDDNVVVFDEV